MPDDELTAAADADGSLARALRGARTLVEAREIARAIMDPIPVALPPEAAPTLGRFVELRTGVGDLDEAGGSRDRPGAEGRWRRPPCAADGADGRRARAGAMDGRRRASR